MTNNLESLVSKISKKVNIISDGVHTINKELKDHKRILNNHTNALINIESKLTNHSSALLNIESKLGIYDDMYKTNKDKINNLSVRVAKFESK